MQLRTGKTTASNNHRAFRERTVKRFIRPNLKSARKGPRVTTSMTKATAGFVVGKPTTKVGKTGKEGQPARKIHVDSLRKKLMTKFHMEQSVVDMILATLLSSPPNTTFDDVIGQEEAVKQLRERVVYPALNPNLFKGQKVLKPPRGVLLFGPTGNGKTLLAKACANQAHYNFMNVSASALISKWVGDSEKLVKLLFECAREIQPTIIFIDEIDAMLSQRGGSERDDSRRFKNEFLIHFDGMLCSNDDHILVLGATNLPQSIDTAALRRFDLKIKMGPPNQEAREHLIKTILRGIKHSIKKDDIRKIASLTEGYSASDLGIIARNAAWLPLGTVKQELIPLLEIENVPAVTVHHFMKVVKSFVPSSSQEDMSALDAWTSLNR